MKRHFDLNGVIRLVLTVAGPQSLCTPLLNAWVDGRYSLTVLAGDNVGLDRGPVGLTRIVQGRSHAIDSMVARHL